MTYTVKPDGFLHELAHNKRARDAYARLSPTEKCRVLARAGKIQSAENLHLFTMSLSDEVEANEYF